MFSQAQDIGQGNAMGLSFWLKGTAGHSIFSPPLNFLREFFWKFCVVPSWRPRLPLTKSRLPSQRWRLSPAYYMQCIIHCNSWSIIGAHRHRYCCNIHHNSVNIQLILNLKTKINQILFAIPSPSSCSFCILGKFWVFPNLLDFLDFFGFSWIFLECWEITG